jgi:hypothetical protein
MLGIDRLRSHPLVPLGRTRRRRGVPGLLATLVLSGVVAATAGCGGGGGEAAETPLFYMTSSDPPNGAQFVSVTKVFRILFNARIDPATVSDASIEVRSSQTGQVTTGHTTIDTFTQGLVWIPDGALPGPLAHVLRISPSLRSQEGHAIGGRLEIQFTTDAPPNVSGLPAAADLRALPVRLQVGRRSHRATLLNDGKVLVTGGFRQGASITDQAEIFDPDTETFKTLAATMTVGRANHTATVLVSGQVLLAGGWIETGPGLIDETATAEVFDPVNETFTAVGPMGTGRVDHAAIRLSNAVVMVTGGSRLDSSAEGYFLVDFDSVEVFDPATLTFSAHSSAMSHTRSTHDMVPTANGLVAIAGGSDVDVRAEVLDPAQGTFHPLPPATSDAGRFGASMERFASGGVVVAGGDLAGTVFYVFPDASRIINTGSGLAQARSYATATRIDPDDVVVAGGLDVAAGLFVAASCDLVREEGPGGSRTFPTTVRFFTGMAMHTATRLQDGVVFYCGGLNVNGGQPELDRAYILDVR